MTARETLMTLLGRQVTVTNPTHPASWSGRLLAIADDPSILIEGEDGDRMCLPQTFVVEPDDGEAPRGVPGAGPPDQAFPASTEEAPPAGALRDQLAEAVELAHARWFKPGSGDRTLHDTLADAVLPVVQAELARVFALHADTERRLRADLAAEVRKREAADAEIQRMLRESPWLRARDEEREDAETRLQLARDTLARDGYFDCDEIGLDIAPRLVEWLTHHRARAETAAQQITAIRQLHRPDPGEIRAAAEAGIPPACAACRHDHPCPTYRATEPTKEPAMPICNATITGPHVPSDEPIRCHREAGHPDAHAVPELAPPTLWTDHHAGATPHDPTLRYSDEPPVDNTPTTDDTTYFPPL